MESELDEELRFHLDREIERNLAAGMSDREARRAALLSFGGVEQMKEAAREVRGLRVLEQAWQDLRHGARLLRKSPGFTAVAVLSLALGIGASTALFSVADALLLSTLPVKEPDRLVLFEWEAGDAFRSSGTDGWSFLGRAGRRGSSSFHSRIFQTLRDKSPALQAVFAFAELRKANLLVGGQAEVADGQYASGGYFTALGVTAALGRLLGEADDRADAPPAAVIGFDYWQARLGGDPGVLGETIAINAVPFTIVGVAPPEFRGTMQLDSRPVVFVTVSMEPRLAPARSHWQPRDGRSGAWWLHLMGRLQPGATVEQARQSLAGVFQALALQLMPPPRSDQPATLAPVDHPVLIAHPGRVGMLESRRGYAATIYRLFGVVALVLLISCANLTNLQLARAAARRVEVTVRSALGAGRGRLVRQLLTESLLLSVLGGAAGVALALAGQALLAASGDGLFPGDVAYGLNGRVLGFSLAVSLITVVLSGLAPALRSTRVDLGTAIKQGSRAAGGVERSRLSKALVVVQVAMSLVLLVGAILFLRTVRNLQAVDVGFNQNDLLLFSLRPESLGHRGASLEPFYERLFARLDALPGVQAATFGRVRLLSRNGSTETLVLPGETPGSVRHHSTHLQVVRENYLATLQIPLLRGRGFSPRDREGAPKVVLVNQTLARRHFPDGDAIGQRLGLDGDFGRPLEIVGIVADSKYNFQRRTIAPLLFLPWRQHLEAAGEMSFAVRVAGPPEALVPAIRREVQELAPGLPLSAVTTQVAQARQTMAAEALMARLLSFFGLVAVLLAVIGLYGVLAWSVAQRTLEIGIRMALGAQTTRVRRMVVSLGLRLVAAGVVLGALAALALAEIVESQLYGVRTGDPATLLLAATALLAVAFLACWFPAVRATRVDPMIALRSG